MPRGARNVKDTETPPLFGHLMRRPDWKPPVVSSLPEWPEHGRVAIDVETYDPTLKTLGPGVRRGGYVVGYSFAIEGGPAYYVGLRHQNGGNVENPEAAVRYLKDQAARFRGDLVGANMQYDLDFLAQMGVAFSPAWYRDVQIADPLIYELHDSYSLENIAKRWGMEGKHEKELRDAAREWKVDPKTELYKLPAEHVEAYAIGDVTLPLAILRKQEEEIAKQELQGVFDLESRLLPVLLKMRRRGVRVDQKRLDQVEELANRASNEACAAIKSETGMSLAPEDVMKRSAIEPILRSIGATSEAIDDAIQVAEEGAGGESLDKEFLSKLKHPIAAHLLRARKFFKIRSTYVEAVRSHMVNGRIHATFNQLKGDWKPGRDEGGAKYGRLSSSDPNLQNQPSRDDEVAKLWRSIYLPEEGALWAACDYSQQEPRVLTHYAELCGCSRAKDFGDKYRNDPKTDTYDGLSEMTRTKRKDTKIIYLGLSYSMGPAKLCRSLKLPTKWIVSKKSGKLVEVAGPEGEALFKAFHSGAPFIGELNELVSKKASRRGFITTLLGRRCRFPENPNFKPNEPETKWNSRYDWGHKALNRLIQGSSADQTKKAVVDLDAAGHFLQLQVHDEIDGSVSGREEGERMAEVMRDTVKLTVPMRVDVEIGSSWGESMG